MAVAQVVETSLTNNSLSQNSNHPDYLFQSRLLLIVELSTTSFWNFHIAVLFRLAQPWLPKMVSPCLVFSFLENVGVEPMLFKRTLKMALHNFVSWPPVRGNSKIATMLPLSRALASILQIMFTELLNQVHLSCCWDAAVAQKQECIQLCHGELTDRAILWLTQDPPSQSKSLNSRVIPRGPVRAPFL